MSDTENLNEVADSGLLQPRLVRLLQRHLFRAKEDFRTKMLGHESSDRLKKLIEETEDAIRDFERETNGITTDEEIESI